MTDLIRMLIILLIRHRLGVKHCHLFQFQDQLDDSWYYFTRYRLMRCTETGTGTSHLSLMYLMYANVGKKL